MDQPFGFGFTGLKKPDFEIDNTIKHNKQLKSNQKRLRHWKILTSSAIEKLRKELKDSQEDPSIFPLTSISLGLCFFHTMEIFNQTWIL